MAIYGVHHALVRRLLFLIKKAVER